MNAESDVFLEILIREKIFLSKEKVEKNQNKTEETGWLTRGNRLLEREADFIRANPATKPD